MGGQEGGEWEEKGENGGKALPGVTRLRSPTATPRWSINRSQSCSKFSTRPMKLIGTGLPLAVV